MAQINVKSGEKNLKTRQQWQSSKQRHFSAIFVNRFRTI